MIIENSMIPQVSSMVKVRNEDFGLLLVSEKTPILALNDDSKLIWNCIDGESSVENIISKLNEEINGTIEDTEKVVKCFLESVYDLRLIELD